MNQFIPWFLLSEEQKDEIRALPLLQRLKFHHENKKYMKELKGYRKNNPYDCFTIKLITAQRLIKK